MRKEHKILIEHDDFGVLEVVPSPEYKYWTGRDGYYCPDDPELGTFEEDVFVFLTPSATILEFKRNAG